MGPALLSYKLPPQVSVDMVRWWIVQATAARALPYNARLAFFYSRYADPLNGNLYAGGPWDIKKFGWQTYQNVGNALYGYLGSAMDLGTLTLRLAAGATQHDGPFRGGGLSEFVNGYLADAADDYRNVSIGIDTWNRGFDPTEYLQ